MNISNYLLIEDLKSSNNVDRDQHLKHLVYHKVSKYSSSDQLQLDYKIDQDGTEMKIFNIMEFHNLACFAIKLCIFITMYRF